MPGEAASATPSLIIYTAVFFAATFHNITPPGFSPPCRQRRFALFIAAYYADGRRH